VEQFLNEFLAYASEIVGNTSETAEAFLLWLLTYDPNLIEDLVRP
jgi:hypothetical protein